MDIIKAAKDVCLDATLPWNAKVTVGAGFVDTLRSALAAHEAAPTVAVPVAVLREWRNGNSIVVGDVVCAEVPMHDIDALLPPREPPRELVAEWEREAHRADPIGSHKNTTMRERECFEAGFVSACRARWAADPKNGGA